MSSQTQTQEVGDLRFKELLKPVKDLTQNWQVDLELILSKYMDDLKNVRITFDGGQTTVDFAQAALVLQGTVSVYGKKVDFLWQLMNKTIDLLHNKKEGEADGEGEEGVGGAKTRKRRCVDMTAEFTELEAVIAKNIHLKGDDESLKARKDALQFIYVTPRQLIEKEGSECKQVKVNLYMGVAASKWDLLAAKEDFRLNSQFVSATGCLGEDLTSDNVYLALSEADQYQPRFSEFRDDLDDCQSRRLTDPPPDPPTSEVSLDLPPPDDVMEDNEDVFETSERAAGLNMSSNNMAEAVTTLPETIEGPSSLKSSLRQRTPSPPPVDPWSPVDPYDCLTTPKNVAKGKTVKLPPSITRQHALEKGKVVKDLAALASIQEYLIEELTMGMYPTSLPNVSPCFHDIAAKVAKNRKQREKERKEKILRARGRRYEDVPDIVLEDGDIHDDPDDGADHQDHDVGPAAVDDGWDDINPHLGGEIGAAVIEDLPVGSAGEEGDAQEEETYEDMVAKRVAAFVQQSQQVVLSSELMKRVAIWHETIGPRLEAVEQRKAFDVHLYGSYILDRLPEKLPEDKRETAEIVQFNVIAGGHKREEVCRYFLSSLMLANTTNVLIQPVNPLDMDQLHLSLLSKTRHHLQLEEFQAASQQAPKNKPKRLRSPEPLPLLIEEESGNLMDGIEEEEDEEDDSFKMPPPPKNKKGRRKK